MSFLVKSTAFFAQYWAGFAYRREGGTVHGEIVISRACEILKACAAFWVLHMWERGSGGRERKNERRDCKYIVHCNAYNFRVDLADLVVWTWCRWMP